MLYVSSSILFINRLITASLPLTLWLASSTAFGQTPSPGGIRELPPNQTLEREVTGSEKHLYKLALRANEFFQVRVEQKGADVVLRLSDAGGKELAHMDSPNGNDGSETLSFVAAESGEAVRPSLLLGTVRSVRQLAMKRHGIAVLKSVRNDPKTRATDFYACTRMQPSR